MDFVKINVYNYLFACILEIIRNLPLIYMGVIASEAERSEASSQSEPLFAKARELLFNVWGVVKEDLVSLCVPL